MNVWIRLLLSSLIILMFFSGCQEKQQVNSGQQKEETSEVKEKEKKLTKVVIADQEGVVSNFGEELLMEILKSEGVKEIKLEKYPNFHDEKIALKMGEIDIIPSNSISKLDEEIRLTMTFYQDKEQNENFAFGVDLKREDLWKKLNKGLINIKKLEKYEEIYQKHFDSETLEADKEETVKDEPAIVEKKSQQPKEVIKESKTEPEDSTKSKEKETVSNPAPSVAKNSEDNQEELVADDSEKTQEENYTEPYVIEHFEADPVVVYIDNFNWGGYLITDFLDAYENENGQLMGEVIWDMGKLLSDIQASLPPDYLADTHAERVGMAEEAMSLMEGYIDYNWQHNLPIKEEPVNRLRTIGEEFLTLD